MHRSQQTAGEVFRVLAPVAIVALGIGGFMVFGQRPEKAPRETPDDVAAAVETAAIEAADGDFTIEIDGVALSYRRVTYSAEVAGRVTKKVKQCRAGHYVDADEFLLEVDPTNYELEAERLTVQIERADQNLAEADVDVRNTESLIELAKENLKLEQDNLARVQQLATKNATTDTSLDTARMKELSSRNALRTLENQLSAFKQRTNTLRAAKKLAQTELKRATVDVARTKVSAPISGTLVTVDVEEGDYVKTGDPLFSINDTETMEVSCQLRVDELYWIWLQAGAFGNHADPDGGKELEFSLQAAAGRRKPELQQAGREATFEIPNIPVEVAFPFRDTEYLWSGVLSRYDGTGLDPSTRTIPCRVRVDAPTDVRVGGDGIAGAVVPPTLFSGMYVKVRIPIETTVPMLRVPMTALHPGGEIWVVRDGKLTVARVDVARKEGETVLLLATADGPRAGERVITSPLAAVEEGMPVKEVGPAPELSPIPVEPDGEVGATACPSESDTAIVSRTASDGQAAPMSGRQSLVSARSSGTPTEDRP